MLELRNVAETTTSAVRKQVLTPSATGVGWVYLVEFDHISSSSIWIFPKIVGFAPKSSILIPGWVDFYPNIAV